ncbi:TPA: hypothetical protein ACX6MH_001477 [Photobacterium damselae]
MHQIHNEMDATYGKRRMLSELKDMGFTVGLALDEKKLNLVAKRPKLHRYPSGGLASVIAPNKLNRQFNPEQLNTYWSVYSNATRLVISRYHHGFMLSSCN